MLDPVDAAGLADLQREITALCDRLDRLYSEAADAIDAISDPDEAFARATAFADANRQFHNDAISRMAKLRARQAVRIRDAESLSLQGLADRISTSKARADQLVREATSRETP